jgi:putative FmdB family regulatory protein
MPLYTYHCDHCGVQFDQQQKFTDSSLTVCPVCKSKKLKKVYSAVGIVFKGSGFYATDHKSPSGMKYSSKSEEKSDEKSDEKSEKISDDKPKESTNKAESGSEPKREIPVKTETPPTS